VNENNQVVKKKKKREYYWLWRYPGESPLAAWLCNLLIMATGLGFLVTMGFLVAIPIRKIIERFF